MLGWLTRQLISVVISLMVFHVPKERYQSELDSLPDIAGRISGANLYGWTLNEAPSARTGLKHYHFSYPAADSAAPVMVCLHGFNTDGRAFVHLSPLADTYRLIAYNFPEKTELYSGSMDDFVGVLDDFFAQIGIDTVALLGNSVGGAVAIHYAASQPSVHVTRLVLLSTNVFGASPEDTKEIQGMADRLLGYPDYKLYYLLTKGKALVARFRKTEIGQTAPAEIIAVKHVAWYRQVLQALYDYDGTPYARRVTCPVLAMHGADDRLIPIERARVIEDLIPHATFEAVDSAGHTLVYLEADRVIARIRETAAANVP
ncbi:MAG: alpha/beta fold hydrolase [Chitinivibrionales bacterium]|nr:alpha/beta fold hydrolase [Chitinivibrionales bacterium]